MSRKDTQGRRWLIVVVLLHLAVSIVHGSVHAAAHVALSQASSLFVFIAIFIGPLAGIALVWRFRRIGGSIIAITMSSSFVFGLVNHFLLNGDDHVFHVDPRWRALFAASAIILAGIELLGSGLAIAYARERWNVS